MERRIYGQTYPVETKNHGKTQNPPDAPIVGRRELDQLSQFLPAGGIKVGPGGVLFNRQDTQHKHTGYQDTLNGTLLTPITAVPLTEPFQTHHGGIRVGGGGISEEALRRAKRKARKNGSNGLS